MALDFHPADKGILPDRMIDALARAGAIVPARPLVPGQIQPASLDLRLDDVAFRVRASFLPGPGTSVASRPSSCIRSTLVTVRCWRPAVSTSCR
jgi:dCTP deaminase